MQSTRPGQLKLSTYGARSMQQVAHVRYDHMRDEWKADSFIAVHWPTSIPTPILARPKRHALEVLLLQHATYGTRKDCIARSSALLVNTTTNDDNKLAKAVTCDIYDFQKTRSDECVCFPVYRDKITSEDRGHGIVTYEFYPPPPVVRRHLMEAAIQGPPQTCTGDDCPKSVGLLSRSPVALDSFPYCPSTALRPTIQLAPRTLGDHFSHTTDPSSIPTTIEKPPKCSLGLPSLLSSKCILAQCIHQYQVHYNSTSSTYTTWSDKNGVPLFANWSSSVIWITTSHWGTPGTSPGQATLTPSTESPRWPQATASAINEAALFGYFNSTDFEMPEPLKCSNSTSCTLHCQEIVHSQHHFTQKAIVIASAISILALGGMIWSWWRGAGRQRRWEKEFEKRYTVQPGQSYDDSGDGPELRVLDAEPTQPVELDPTSPGRRTVFAPSTEQNSGSSPPGSPRRGGSGSGGYGSMFVHSGSPKRTTEETDSPDSEPVPHPKKPHHHHMVIRGTIPMEESSSSSEEEKEMDRMSEQLDRMDEEEKIEMKAAKGKEKAKAKAEAEAVKEANQAAKEREKEGSHAGSLSSSLRRKGKEWEGKILPKVRFGAVEELGLTSGRDEGGLDGELGGWMPSAAE